MRKVKYITQDAKKTKNVKNRRKIITVSCIAVLAAALITVLIILISSGSIKKFSSTTTGGIRNTANGKTYTICDGNISPRNIGEQYGEFEGIKLFRLYTVNGEEVSPDDYLVDEDGILFCGLDVKKITLEDFKAIGAYFFYQGSATGGQLFPKKEYLPESEQGKDGLPDDSQLTKKITDSVINGETVVPTGGVDGNTMFELKFCSADYPAFYYSLFCLKDENGSAYIYDSNANEYYDCPDELAVRLW